MTFRTTSRIGTIALSAAAGLASTAEAGINNFISNAALEYWGNGGNWSGGVPGAGDFVYIGNTVQAENGILKLDENMHSQIDWIEITDGMTLDTNGYLMLTSGATVLLDGQNQIDNMIYTSRLSVDESGYWHDAAMNYGLLMNGASISLRNQSELQVWTELTTNPGTSIYGRGTIYFESDSPDPAERALDHRGSIYAQPGIMTLTQNGSALLDLDGYNDVGASTALVRASQRNLETLEHSHVIVNGTQLADEFDGTLFMGLDGRIDMNLSSGWTLGPDGRVEFVGSPNDYPVLGGDTMTVLGTIESNAENAEIECNVNIQNGAHTIVLDGEGLTFTGNTIANTTLFSVENGGTLNFAGPSNLTNNGYNLYGGTMTGANILNTSSYGIRGHGTVENRIINDGDITAEDGVLYIDGFSNDWDGIGNDGRLQAMWTGDLHIQDHVDEDFNGELWIGNGRQVTIDDFAFNMTSGSYLYMWNATLNANEQLNFGGEFDVLTEAHINADADLKSTAQLTITGPLNFNQDTRIETGVTISSGAGGLIVGGASGVLEFQDDVVIDVDVQGKGLTILDANVGQATVNDNFVLVGTLAIQLGLPAAGLGDHLAVADTIEARGHFDVVAFNYQPQLNDEFDVLDFTTFVDLGYTMSLPPLAASLAWDVSQFETDGILKVDISTCIADINNDGIVGMVDLLMLLAAWGTPDLEADLDENGIVEVVDLLQLLASWGAC